MKQTSSKRKQKQKQKRKQKQKQQAEAKAKAEAEAKAKAEAEAKAKAEAEAKTETKTDTKSKSKNEQGKSQSVPQTNTNNQASADNYKASCTWLAESDRGLLLRYTDEYLGKKVATSGKIMQFIPVTYSGLDKVMQKLGIGSSEYPYAMSIDGGDGTEDCRYIVFYNDATSTTNMLTGDIVTVYGLFAGTQLMEMNIGSDYFPVIKAKYIEY